MTISTVNVCKFSQDRKHRYRLDFRVAPAEEIRGRVVWVLLNPSTADEDHLDPTLRRVRRFSLEWGYGAVTVVNLFAWRATKPTVLRRVPDPIGPDNDREILEAVQGADLVVLAWGLPPSRLRGRARQVEELLERADVLADCMALGTTKTGEPRHPLYLRGDIELEDYSPWQLWADRGEVEPYRPGNI